jgi:hypothetical protein
MGRAVAAAVYVAAAVVVTWPLATVATTHLGALEGPGDPYLNLWVLGWGVNAWITDPLGTLSGHAFDAPIFHPATGTLTYSDHQLLQSLVASPVYAATGNLALTYNFILLLSIAASGLAMHACTHALTGSLAGAYLAGLVWSCWPYRTAHLLHLQLQALYFLPLAVWAVARIAAGRRWRDAALLGVTAALQAVASVYYGVMTAVALVLATPVLAWTSGQWRRTAFWSRALAAAALAAAIVLPVALVYVRAQAIAGFGRTLYEATAHSASLQSYTQVPPQNLLYGRTGLLSPRDPGPGERDRRHVEHQMFPGVGLMLLALVGLAAGWRSDRRPLVATSLVLIVAGVWLSLGPEGPLGAYAWLAARLPGFDAIRAPARFAVVAMLGAALLAATGLAVLAGRRRRLGALVIVVALLEYVNVGQAFVPAPPTTTQVGRWLREAHEPGPVAYLPVALDRENTPFMVAALEHGRPIVNGYSGQRPLFYTAVVEALSTLPGPEALQMLQDLDVRFVVAPSPIEGAGQPASPFVERAAFAEGIVYEVRWTPEATAAAIVAPGPPPPPVGSIPFAAGESAEYRIQWVGGPLDLPAGLATLRVGGEADARSLAPAAWLFRATASTADWVSRFFEAEYDLATAADADLRPMLHVRTTREGPRRASRRFEYDNVAAEVRPASPSDGPATPLVPDARDALSALYYVRTLALEPGDRISIPINDAGRTLSLSLVVEAEDTVTTPAGQRATLRLAPVITRRLDRRAPVRATVWLSTDEYRVPIVFDVEAGFGRVRAELVNYRP